MNFTITRECFKMKKLLSMMVCITLALALFSSCENSEPVEFEYGLDEEEVHDAVYPPSEHEPEPITMPTPQPTPTPTPQPQLTFTPTQPAQDPSPSESAQEQSASSVPQGQSGEASQPADGIRVIIEEWDGPSPTALELIYEDNTHQYYLSSIRSELIMLTFEDGQIISLKDAVSGGKIGIADLIASGLDVITQPK
jgi:hypothetical protein